MDLALGVVVVKCMTKRRTPTRVYPKNMRTVWMKGWKKVRWLVPIVLMTCMFCSLRTMLFWVY